VGASVIVGDAVSVGETVVDVGAGKICEHEASKTDVRRIKYFMATLLEKIRHYSPQGDGGRFTLICGQLFSHPKHFPAYWQKKDQLQNNVKMRIRATTHNTFK